MRIALLLSSLLVFSQSVSAAESGPGIDILVLREHGVGTAAQAQQYVDRLVEAAAEANGWDKASGRYFTSREQAKDWIDAQSPEFGIMTVPAFLALRKAEKLEVLGSADVKGAGGRQYHVIGKTAKTLAACKGKSFATDHADDPIFIDRVVANGAFKLADFNVDATRRPLQTIKQVIRGESECALIDDAQRDDLANVEGGKALEVVWSSKTLPPMVVVAFPAAQPAAKKAFRQKLPALCRGKGEKACQDAGIVAFKTSGAAAYKAVIGQYDG